MMNIDAMKAATATHQDGCSFGGRLRTRVSGQQHLAGGGERASNQVPRRAVRLELPGALDGRGAQTEGLIGMLLYLRRMPAQQPVIHARQYMIARLRSPAIDA